MQWQLPRPLSMSLYSVAKIPHPVHDQRVADENRRTICGARGYCGPFINMAYYDSFPDPMWRGTGECIVCCNTCNVSVEEDKQRAATDAAIRLHLRASAPPGSGRTSAALETAPPG